MKDINKFFHSIADEVDKVRQPTQDAMLSSIARVKDELANRRRDERAAAEWQARINQQRDQLLVRMANILGIPPEDFETFFDQAE